MTYRSLTSRMAVTVPEGEVDGLKVIRREVVTIDDWTSEHDKRTDVVPVLEYARMLRDDRAPLPGWYTLLVDYKNLDCGQPVTWMSDTTAERDDHKDPVAHIEFNKSKRVLINGLGLGMVLQAALSYDHVEHVDVVEYDERVIKLVGPHYLTDPRVNIIHADAYEQTKLWPKGAHWDTGWSDIWPEISADNLDGMDQLHKHYRRRCGYHGMWARQLCLKLRREERESEMYISATYGIRW